MPSLGHAQNARFLPESTRSNRRFLPHVKDS
jgi:hypothetical protein